MLLNCDLGESFGAWTMGMDSALMPLIDQANIACGFHAGDPLTIEKTLRLAGEYGVSIGAHPAYPDLAGFGRRSLAMSKAELRATLHYQIAALDGMAAAAGLALDYVKPHGALYNDMMRNTALRLTIMDSIASYPRPLRLMLQATPDAPAHRAEASERGLELWLEAFADRLYDDRGLLVSRQEPGAVHDYPGMLAQAQQLLTDCSVTSAAGSLLPLAADTLCVHGDTADAVAAVTALRALLRHD